jgi:SIR2-like protein
VLHGFQKSATSAVHLDNSLPPEFPLLHAGMHGSQSRLRDAVVSLFHRLNLALLDETFEFSNDVKYQVSQFLAKFDAIFSLNQDLLLECHYLERFPLGGRWNGAVVAGMKPESLGHDHYGPLDKIWVPTGDFGVPRNMQPFVKLHGSTQWKAASGDPILIMGNAKSGAIQSFEVLRQHHVFFATSLNQANSKLMVIGYSFQDDHINEVIVRASARHSLGTYIVDPSGRRALQHPSVRLRPIESIKLIGELRRPLSLVFGKDRFAFQELMRFFR